MCFKFDTAYPRYKLFMKEIVSYLVSLNIKLERVCMVLPLDSVTTKGYPPVDK